MDTCCWWASARANRSSSIPIETFIFMDFESTNLFADHRWDPISQRWRAGDRQRKPESMLELAFKYGEPSSKEPCITELSFISVPRVLFERGVRHMANVHAISHANNSINGSDFTDPIQMTDPNNCLKTRVAANVHTRQINPELSNEEWDSFEKHIRRFQFSPSNPFNLDREELLTKNNFEKEWHCGLHDFLQSARKPACLVAYNGVKFDFRLLLHELKKCNGFFETHFIPHGIVLIDAYLAFLDIEKSYHESIKKSINSINWRMVTKLALSVSESKMSTEREESNIQNKSISELTKATRAVEALTLAGTPTRSCDSSEITPRKPLQEKGTVQLHSEQITAPVRLAKRNLSAVYATLKQPEESELHTQPNSLLKYNLEANVFTQSNTEQDTLRRPCDNVSGTPPKRKCVVVEKQACQSEPTKGNLALNVYENAHPLRFLNSSTWTPAKKRRIKAQFFQRSNDGDWRFNPPSDYFFGKGNFKLENLYKQVIRGELDAHRAQDDTEALAQLCMAYGNDFLRYADAQYFSFPDGSVLSRHNASLTQTNVDLAEAPNFD